VIPSLLLPPTPIEGITSRFIIEGGSSSSSDSSRRLAAISSRIEVQDDAIASEVPTADVAKTGSGGYIERSGLKERVGLDAWRRRRVHGHSAPLVVVLVKPIHISVETEYAYVLVAGIIVSQAANILNLGGRDHARSIRQHTGVSREDKRHVVAENSAKCSDEDEACDHGERTVQRSRGAKDDGGGRDLAEAAHAQRELQMTGAPVVTEASRSGDGHCC
jgi:hypothetical protein